MTAVSTTMTSSKEEITRWAGWPLRQRPALGILTLGVLFLAAYALRAESPWLAPLVVLVPVLVNGRYFFPTRFEATTDGLTATHVTFAPRTMRWDAVERIVLDRPGVWMVVPKKTHRFARVRIMPVYEDISTPRVASILANYWEPRP